MTVYAMRDMKTEFLTPFPAKTEEEAKRIFAFNLNSNPMLDTNRVDFELYALGEFDVTSGKLSGLENPKRVDEGRNYVREENKISDSVR